MGEHLVSLIYRCVMKLSIKYVQLIGDLYLGLPRRGLLVLLEPTVGHTGQLSLADGRGQGHSGAILHRGAGPESPGDRVLFARDPRVLEAYAVALSVYLKDEKDPKGQDVRGMLR